MQEALLDWFKENARTLVIAVVSVAVLGSGVVWYRWNKASKRRQSGELLRLGVTLYYQARQGDKPVFDRAIASLTNVVDTFPGSPVAAQASLYLGHIYYQQGDYRTSLEHYSKAASVLQDDSPFMELALLDVAYSKEANGDYEEAIAAFKRSLVLEHGLLKDRAVIGIGRCYEELGMVSEAIETYSAMLKRFPNSPWAEVLKQRLEALQGPKSKT
jgi:tetratricopeptide (TPR) repeat protein